MSNSPTITKAKHPTTSQMDLSFIEGSSDGASWIGDRARMIGAAEAG
jgi:hypothetical protein